MTTYPTPTKPGTADEEEFTPCKKYEVVEVFENCIDKDDPEYLMVAVTGVARSQSIENFFWGPGPLEPPKD